VSSRGCISSRRGTIALGFVLTYLIAVAVATSSPAAVNGGSTRPPSTAHPLGAGLERVPPVKPRSAEISPSQTRRQVVLKFAEGSDVRLANGRFVTEGKESLAKLHEVLDRYDGVAATRTVQTSSPQVIERRTNFVERTSGRDVADMNLYYDLAVPKGTRTVDLINDLNRLSIVELAQADLKPPPDPNHAGPTPLFVTNQGYRNAAPNGVDADFANLVPGGTGSNTEIIDIEREWRDTHEDLDSASGAQIANGTAIPVNNPNHGTAVLGEMIATNDLTGVTGISHGATPGMVSHTNTSGFKLVDAINAAVAATGPGDVILLEVQVGGPKTTCVDGGDMSGCCSSLGQEGCVAVEHYQQYYDAIVNATAAGRIVVEAAGNGNEDYDDATLYNDIQTRTDSGAIMVGASNNYGCTNPPHGRSGFSNHGARVDLHAFGQCVTTTGYGNLQNDPDDDFDYTNGFGGTSAASPIVASSAAIVSSVAEQRGDADGLTSVEARTILEIGATPQETGSGALAGNIGPMPNLASALGAPFADAGSYSTDEGTAVTLDGTGSGDSLPGFITSYEWDLDADGQFDDATGATPSFTPPDSGSIPIALRVTDNDGLTATDPGSLNVQNVDPQVTLDPSQDMEIEVGDSLTVTAGFEDQGWEDTYTASVDWGDGTQDFPAPFVTTEGPPRDEGTVSATRTFDTYGTFTVRTEVRDDDGGVGFDEFTLRVVPRCQGELATVFGSTGNDVLSGTGADDVIFGGSGSDVIRAKDREDLICAGSGSDRINAESGDDEIYAGDGADLVQGSAGNDRLFGNEGDDELAGRSGNDELDGGPGSDTLRGGPGSDLCTNDSSDPGATECEE
jgi:serine protease